MSFFYRIKKKAFYNALMKNLINNIESKNYV